jgi:hypothetical protein
MKPLGNIVGGFASVLVGTVLLRAKGHKILIGVRGATVYIN